MRYAVIDVETTGFSPRTDRVVEMACVLVQDRRIVRSWSTLVNPGRTIPDYATRIHGISDADVADAPSFAAAQGRLRRMCAGATMVAHNAGFDRGFLPGIAHLPWLCTVRLARRSFPAAPNYKCQTLRSYLDVDDHLFRLVRGDERQMQPHRALGDALVTAGILLRCLDTFRQAPADTTGDLIHLHG